MSVDAAALFAQIEAALLIALALEVKGTHRDRHAMMNAVWNLLGITAALLALAVSLASATANRPLSTLAACVVAGLTAAAAFSLLANTLDRFDEIHGVGTTWTNVMAAVLTVVWMAFFLWLKAFL
jgi:hypothetical protein